MLTKWNGWLAVALAVLMMCSLAACGGGGGGNSTAQSNLTGSAEEALTKLIEDITAAGVEMPAMSPAVAVAADMSQNTVGLSSEDFDKYVTGAASSMAAIGTFAHQIAVIQAKDSASAAEVKKLISSDGGYNAGKWICVHPDQAAAVESGSYILLVASSNAVCDAAVKAFTDAAGSVGEVNAFYKAA